MNDGLASTLVAWLPLLVIVIVWLLFMRQMRNPRKGISQYTYMEQSLKSQDEHNRALLAIIERMDQRIASLEMSDRDTSSRT